MRKYVVLTVTVVLAILAVTSAFAETAAPAGADSTRTLKPQTVCPVMGGPIDSACYTDIQGQRVYHCCPMCSEKLKADPDKYFKKAAEEGVLFQNIQKVCPVTGEPIDTTVFTDYEGRRIYFCCDMCPSKFNQDPQKYLNSMDRPKDSPAAQPKMDMSHGDQMEHHEGN
jgi:YHS domain-containing protein